MSAVATLAHVRAVAEKDGTFNLKHAFAQFDVDGDGSISHEELSTILLSLIPDLAYDEILSVINLFDPNNDGDISYVEFAHTFYTSEDYDHEAKAKQSMVKIRRMAASKKGFSLRSAFQRFDVDGDGSVSHDELKVVINDILQGDITENEMQDVIKLFDPDNDGEINYKEFRDLFYSISIETEKTRSICEHTNENIDDAYVETHIIPGLMRDEYCALKLSHNNIGDEGAVEISNAISDDKSQCSIVDLRNNKITAESSEAIGKALGTNVYVHTLLLSHNTLTGEGAANICASLAPTNAGFSAISTLDLRHCDIDDNGGGRLGLSLVGNTALKNVSLCGNRLGRKAGESIAKALGNTRCIIESINLANNTIDSVGARALAFSLKANRECKEFIISGNVGVGDSGVSAFAEVLEGVEEGDTVRCGLRVLGLAGCGVGDGGIVELMGGLRSNEVLATLDLRCNSFGDDGGVAIGRSLEENTAIRELYLGSNELRTAAATAMGSALEKNVSLLVLDLSNTDLSGKNAGLLADGLHKNEALLELNVSRSEISDNGMSNFVSVFCESASAAQCAVSVCSISVSVSVMLALSGGVRVI